MKNLIMTLLVIVAAHLPLSANAGIITVSVDQTEVAVGDSVEVSLLATGFDFFDVFDLDVLFDSSVFSYDSASFSSDLPSFPFGVSALETPTELAISFVDFLPYAGGDFMLAQFNLTALTAGVTDFSLNISEFSLSDPFDIFAPAQQLSVSVDGQSSVTVTSVPEPTTVFLMLVAIAVISLSRKVRSF